jgi:hypothetical protein
VGVHGRVSSIRGGPLSTTSSKLSAPPQARAGRPEGKPVPAEPWPAFPAEPEVDQGEGVTSPLAR